jgi:hypothetical protein
MALVGEAGPELIIDLKKAAGGTVAAPEDPLYTKITRNAYGLGGDDDNAPQKQPADSNSGGVLGDIGSALGPMSLVGAGLGVLGKYLNRPKEQKTEMATGGVVSVQKPSPLGKSGHHPYGKKGMPKSRILMPKTEFVNKPQIRMLGESVPQAVLPLNNKKGNKVTANMIPKLLERYGV